MAAAASLVASTGMTTGAGRTVNAGLSVNAGRTVNAGTTAPRLATVATGPARSLGEPAAAQDSAASVVAATSFGSAGARTEVWTSRAGTTTWRQAGFLLPTGFGTSYDPAAAASPAGPLLVVAGTAPPGEQCITNGSVAIASVTARGRLGPARLVSDQRGTGSFDDRPAVATGQHGMVWVAWSQGPAADACQDVGPGDQIEVALSRDGGRTFGAPVAMPAGGGHAAFGVRLASLNAAQVAVSWTETMPTGDQGVLVSVLDADGHFRPPQAVVTGSGPPLVLPGASFYDFPAGDVAVLPDGRLAVAAPFWAAGRSVIKLAVGSPGGRWQEAGVNPPAGADLLLPALGVLTAGGVRLLCAVHVRHGDHLGYEWTGLTLGAHGPAAGQAGLTALTRAPAGPGFFEVGEELGLAPTRHGLFTAVVVAGADGATLEAASFTAPVAAPPRAHPATHEPARSATPGATARAGTGAASGLAAAAGSLGAAALAGAAVAGTVLTRRRRRPGAHRSRERQRLRRKSI